MSVPIERREFLAATACATLAMASGLSRRAAAIEPVKRSGSAHFKFSLAAYSYDELLKGEQPQLTLLDFVRDCATMPLDGAELTSYYFPKKVTKKYLLELKELCFRQGLDVSGTAVGNDFCHLDERERARQIAYVKYWIEHAAVLGAPVIRIFAGQAKDNDLAKARKLVISAIEECCAFAGKYGIYLALENHGGLTDSADDMLSLVRDVRSPWFGVNLDTGNFHSRDIAADLAKLAPYAVNVQAKVINWGSDGRKRPADLKQLAKILAAARYRGYVVLEFEKSAPELLKADPRVACRKYLGQLRQAFDGLMT